MKFKTQVTKNHYYTRKYDSKDRWISYWYQINEVTKKNPTNLLEIGLGNGLVSNYLKERGFKITTCDIDKDLNPDYIASVTNLPFKKYQFDFVLCAQVLEHLPFKDFTKALTSLNKVTKKWVLITLPDWSVTDLFFGIKIIPFIPKWTKTVKIRLPITHQFNKEHYWEIGKKGYSLEKIRMLIRESGFNIEEEYNPEENPYHRFFLLSKV